MTTPTRSNYEQALHVLHEGAPASIAQVYATLAVADAIRECCTAITDSGSATREAFAEYAARQVSNQ